MPTAALMLRFDMTDEQVKLAKSAAKLAQAHLSGAKLYEALKIGESLLVGRAAAMKTAGSNKPSGRTYAEAFRAWKAAFKFPIGKEAEALYDAAIVCAQHRSLADGIIAELPIKKRAEMGAFGLAVRVRVKLREFEDGPVTSPPPRQASAGLARRSRRDEYEGRLADLEERLTAARGENPLAYWREAPEEVARIMVRADRRQAQALADALSEALVDEIGEKDQSKRRH
jgi:hypothetical protein